MLHCPWVVPTSARLIVLERNSGPLSNDFWRAGHMLTWLIFCCCLSRHGLRLVSYLAHIQIMFQNTLNWHIWNSQYVCSFTDSGCSVFEGRFLHSFHILICFVCLLMDVLSVCHLQQRSHCCLTLKSAQKLVWFLWHALQKRHLTFTKFV